MKFLVDANLPLGLALILRNNGFDVLHTDDLPNKERTSDSEIRDISFQQERIVITKDSDFLDSHLIRGIPAKLLFISTGNITNKKLLELIEKYFELAIQLFESYNLVEISNNDIIVHEE